MNLIESSFNHRKFSVPAAPRSIGAILIDNGRLSPENAERILFHQKERGMRFGDAAIELGLLREDDIRHALSRQFDYPYLAAGDGSLGAELVAAYQPFSPVVEQLRVLRSQLMLRWFDAAAQRKLLALVSPTRGDGRSFMAANLAVVFSQLGERTLLIDANLRNPRQDRIFNLGNAAGLSDMLVGRADENAVVPLSALVGLSVLPAGATPPNPQELLGRPAFAETLARLAERHDVVIIDTPAADDCADAQTIAARAGAAVLVGRKNRTTLPALTRLAADLQQSGTVLVGSVLNEG